VAASSGELSTRYEATMRVVVLTCGDLGSLVANSLAALDSVSAVALVRSPWPTRPSKSLTRRILAAYRSLGPRGFAERIAARVISSFRTETALSEPPLAPGVSPRTFADLHSDEAISFVRDFNADLGVVAGTHILRERLFNLPRLGSINIHSGKVPDYRGSAPAFWELYDGQREVGISIHQVTSTLDGGDVFLTQCFPLDHAPADDPMAYIERFRENVLRPNGVRLATECVDRIARGTIVSRPQPRTGGRTNKQPLYSDICELRRRVASRRTVGYAVVP
jgi:folate-dependent phosphoribosylglycinamide formyltransferase PurN